MLTAKHGLPWAAREVSRKLRIRSSTKWLMGTDGQVEKAFPNCFSFNLLIYERTFKVLLTHRYCDVRRLLISVVKFSMKAKRYSASTVSIYRL